MRLIAKDLEQIMGSLIARKNGKVRWLLEHNRLQSAHYTNDEVRKARREYRHTHRTKIAAFKCMDGRLNLPLITGIPVGIIQPYRNLGGYFEFGWAYLQAAFVEWVRYAAIREDDCLVFTTYHFSKDHKHLGCKGFECDKGRAMEAADHFRRRIGDVCQGAKKNRIFPVMIGIETDEDAIIVHGEGEPWDLAGETGTDETKLAERLGQLFPAMPPHVICDFLPLIKGNVAHIKEVRAQGRTLIQADHNEQILGLGRGFDWLHTPNLALLIGPFSYNVAEPIEKAAGILLDNLESGRIPSSEGIVLMAAGAYRSEQAELGFEARLAEEKALDLARFAVATIARDERMREKLLPHLSILAGEIDMDTRLFTDRTEKLIESL